MSFKDLYKWAFLCVLPLCTPMRQFYTLSSYMYKYVCLYYNYVEERLHSSIGICAYMRGNTVQRWNALFFEIQTIFTQSSENTVTNPDLGLDITNHSSTLHHPQQPQRKNKQLTSSPVASILENDKRRRTLSSSPGIAPTGRHVWPIEDFGGWSHNGTSTHTVAWNCTMRRSNALYFHAWVNLTLPPWT